MVTRQSTLRETFDPAAFHRSTAMTQSGWAEREVRKNSGGWEVTLGRFSSVITLVLGALLAITLRPPDIMDTRDVIVSLVAIGASVLVGSVGARLVMSVFRTSVEIDRIVSWSVALVLGLGVALAGIVPSFARDPGDYVPQMPGYKLTSSADLDQIELAAKSDGSFAEVGLWNVDVGAQEDAALGVFVVADDRAIAASGESRFLMSAVGERPGSRIVHVGRRDVLVSSAGGQTQFAWLDESALIVVAGRDRNAVWPFVTEMLRAAR